MESSQVAPNANTDKPGQVALSADRPCYGGT